MLYIIGLGLDERDISLKAVEALKKCSAIYCESYTGRWDGNISNIEKINRKKVKLLERKDVESDFLVNEARKKKIALLVPGDPLAATTHFQLFLDAKNEGIECEVIHAASIYTAVAETGLQLYKFGRATTLTSHSAMSPYDVIRENKKAGLHSLVLLDIDMVVEDGVKALIENKAISENEKIIVCRNLGTKKSEIKYEDVNKIKMKGLQAVIIVPGKLNFKEEEALELWK